MKAMTCPQCGALIKKISLKDKFAECEYCEARILLEENRDRIVEIPDKPDVPPPSPWEVYRENYRKVNERTRQPGSYDYEPEPTNSSAGVVVIIGLIALVGGIIIFAAFRNSSPPPSVNTAQKTTLKEPTPLPLSFYKTPTPAPQVNYQVKVQWSGANDMEQFENPQIDVSKLPTTDEAELKKTVFKNRAVQVRVTIGTEGEVTSAEAVSGHPILAEASVEAAKKTLFNSRPKPTTRVLTYYFRLLSD
jgi:DNA-directed RNA polymerase subunit RPC12/RpoP